MAEQKQIETKFSLLLFVNALLHYAACVATCLATNLFWKFELHDQGCYTVQRFLHATCLAIVTRRHWALLKAWFHASEILREKLFMRNTDGWAWLILFNSLAFFAFAVSRTDFYSLAKRNFFSHRVKSMELFMCNQWRSQPDNLVPLCKFQIIIIIHFFRNWWFSQSVNCKYLHSGTKSSGWLRYCVQPSVFRINKFSQRISLAWNRSLYISGDRAPILSSIEIIKE